MSRLHLEVLEGDCVRIGDAIITIERKEGKKSRFCIEADRSIEIELIKKPRKSEEKNTINSRMSAIDHKEGTSSWQEQSSG